MTGETAALEGGFEWAIVEIFGHRQHVGKAREEERFGAKVLRIDVPLLEEDNYIRYSRVPLDLATVKVASWSTHYYGGAAIFSYTVTDELTVMKSAHRRVAAPAIPYREPNDPMDADFTEVGEDAFDEVKGG